MGPIAAGRKNRGALRVGSAVRRPGDAGLGRPSDVSMMQPTDFGNRHDRAQRRPLDGPPVWRVLVEREVSAGAVIIREVAGQDAAQVPLAEHKDMVQTLTAHRADEPLREGVCHGLWGAVRISSIPMPFTLCRNECP